MIRKIIHIDPKKCNGCGACVDACHEGAIIMQDGKAVLLRDDYCDGLGDCLPACPTGAISFETREALPYDEQAVLAHIQEKKSTLPCGCPGSMSREILPASPILSNLNSSKNSPPSALRQWPVQIRLVPTNATFFHEAELVIAADCTAYAYANFHAKFMQKKITLIGCPKLDNDEYVEKLQKIIQSNTITSITVVRMSVPCCEGIAKVVLKAATGLRIPIELVIISPEGHVVEQKTVSC